MLSVVKVVQKYRDIAAILVNIDACWDIKGRKFASIF